jgi:hypothetical protein
LRRTGRRFGCCLARDQRGRVRPTERNVCARCGPSLAYSPSSLRQTVRRFVLRTVNQTLTLCSLICTHRNRGQPVLPFEHRNQSLEHKAANRYEPVRLEVRSSATTHQRPLQSGSLGKDRVPVSSGLLGPTSRMVCARTKTRARHNHWRLADRQPKVVGMAAAWLPKVPYPERV